MLDDLVGAAGVVNRQARPPFGVTHHRGPELRIARQASVIRCTGQQCDEAQALW